VWTRWPNRINMLPRKQRYRTLVERKRIRWRSPLPVPALAVTRDCQVCRSLMPWQQISEPNVGAEEMRIAVTLVQEGERGRN